MKQWIPRSLRNDGMIEGHDIPTYASDVTPYVLLSDHEHAIAEKDREIAQIKHECAQVKEAYDAKVTGVPLGPVIGAQTIINQQIAYHALMRQAVEFAENTIYIMGALCPNRHELESNGHVLKSRAFLACPEVQAWRKRDGKEMIWTTDKPTKPGWYWWRYDRSTPRLSMCEIVVEDGGLYELDIMGHTRELVDDGEWSSGPIPEPEEQL